MQYLIAFLICIPILGCGRAPIGVVNPEDARHDYSNPLGKRSETDARSCLRQALDNAAKSENAIVFVHFDWAPMVHQRKFYYAFLERYLLSEGKPFVNFHDIDFTSVSSSDELSQWDGWSEFLREQGGRFYGGGGDMVWLKRGRVVNMQTTVEFGSVHEAIARTQKLFAE